MELHLLDMGTEKYGDCILLTHGEKRILIDGGHPGDTASIRYQLAKILGKQSPFKIDLLIVTHCHADHIGCLPQLVKLGYIVPTEALLANPEYRWFDSMNGLADSLEDSVKDGLDFNPDFALSEALDEEDRSDMPDDELEEFLFDAPRLGPSYQEMIELLKTNGCAVYLYNGILSEHTDLEERFSEFGLEILGPTPEHLEITKESLKKKRSKKAVSDFVSSEDSVEKVKITTVYRNLIASLKSPVADTAFQNSGAINSQSIVLKIKSQTEGWTALLAGDMQFASADVTGLDEIMQTLLKKVYQAGPYDFIKTSHHSSENAVNKEMIDHWVSEKTVFFAHTGGLNDVHHPDSTVLKILESHTDKINFARTDRNGIISVKKVKDGELQMWISKGDFNNFETNKRIDDVNTGVNQPGIIEKKEFLRPATPFIERKNTQDFVEVTAKIPHESTTVRLTIEIDPQKKNF